MVRVFSYLHRDKRTGILYFRRSIPKRYRHYFGGKYEYKKSLRTSDKKAALVQAVAMNALLERAFERFEGQQMGKDDNFVFEKIVIGEIETPGGGKVKDVVIDTGDDTKDVEIYRQMTNTPNVPAAKPKARREESARLATVCDKYRQEKIKEGSWRQKTADEHEATHNLMLQVFRNVEIDTITHRHARKFKEILLQIPSNYTKGQYAGMTVKQMIAMRPEKTMSIKTINDNYLQRLSSLFGWAVRHGYCTTNVFAGLKMKNPGKASGQKEPFTDNDLKVIFNPALYTVGKLKAEWKYWVPLIALYSGLRREEICQLRLVDIVQEDGVFGFDINDKHRKLKNESSKRVVPVHPRLVERGLMGYIDSVNDPDGRLFAALFDTQTIPPGEKLGRWFNTTYLKKCGLKPTERKISFHSFRHSFINQFKKAGVQETKVMQLTGHAHDNITYGRYGSEHSLSELFEVINEVDFDLG